MTEIDKIKRYVDKHGARCNLRYDINMKEAIAIARERTD